MITASIVVYKTDKKELKNILDCLDSSNIERIYIVDNSPTKELYELFSSYNKVDYFWGQGNVGYGAAHNIAIRKAVKEKSDFHIVLNSDIYFKAEIIDQMLTYMNFNPLVGLIMPKILSPDGQLQYLCKLLPTPLDLILRRFLPFQTFLKRTFKFEMRDSGYNDIMEVPFLSGCFMFLRVDVLKKVKGFDDNFFMYCEDLDLCRRIGMTGFKTIYYPMVEIVHIHRKESYKSMMMLKIHIKSAILYFNKWGWFFDSYRKRINRKMRKQYCDIKN